MINKLQSPQYLFQRLFLGIAVVSACAIIIQPKNTRSHHWDFEDPLSLHGNYILILLSICSHRLFISREHLEYIHKDQYPHLNHRNSTSKRTYQTMVIMPFISRQYIDWIMSCLGVCCNNADLSFHGICPFPVSRGVFFNKSTDVPILDVMCCYEN